MVKQSRKKSSAIQTERLTGKNLLTEVQRLGALRKGEKAKACGYVSHTKDGKEKANLTEFMTALLDAQGISLDAEMSPSRRGRSLSYKATVQANGTIIIGAGYTKEMGLKSGDLFDIKLGRKNFKLRLVGDENLKGEDSFDEIELEEDPRFDDDEIE